MRKLAESAEKHLGVWFNLRDAKTTNNSIENNNNNGMYSRVNTMMTSKSSEFVPKANLDGKVAWQEKNPVNSKVQSNTSSRGREILFIQ